MELKSAKETIQKYVKELLEKAKHDIDRLAQFEELCQEIEKERKKMHEKYSL